MLAVVRSLALKVWLTERACWPMMLRATDRPRATACTDCPPTETAAATERRKASISELSSAMTLMAGASLAAPWATKLTRWAKASVLPLMRLKASVPPPATAGPPLVLAETATAEAVPLAMMLEVREALMAKLPLRAVMSGAVAPSLPLMDAMTSLLMSLRDRLRPTETALEPPEALAATETALAETRALMAERLLASTRMDAALTALSPSSEALTSAAILFMATTGAMVIALWSSVDLTSALMAAAAPLMVAVMLPFQSANTFK